MRKTALAATAALTLGILLTGCAGSTTGGSNAETPSSAVSSPAASEPMAEHRTGDFEGLNEKNVSGSVEVSDMAVTLTGFSSDEGPDLHIYLTNGTDEAAVAAGVELGAVAFDQASQTFSLDGMDAAMYSDVVIHCDKAKAVFGAAALS